MKALLATVLAVFGLAAGTHAQMVAEEIGYVDVRRISEESQEAKAANEKLEALRGERNAEIARLREEVQADEQRLLESDALLNDEARVEQAREVQRKQMELQRFTEDAQSELQRLRRELEAALREKLLPAVLFVARERSLMIVVRRDDPNLLWADPILDITDDVIARMDLPAPGTETVAPPESPPPAAWLADTPLLQTAEIFPPFR